jgi:hypothetical protein
LAGLIFPFRRTSFASRSGFSNLKLIGSGINIMQQESVLVVEKQLAAYNLKDAVMWAATYAEDAVQQTTDGIILATGRDEIHRNILVRFQEPDLKAILLSRTVHDNVVIDHEKVIRNFPEGVGSVEMLCIYTVEAGYIKRGIFKTFNQQLTRP